MDTRLFDYHLPSELIAETPLDRGDSRMMIVDRENGTFTHSHFRNITEFIDSSTTVVFNSTKVIPARIFGKRVTGGSVEFLLVKNVRNDIWQVMVKCSKHLSQGEKIYFPENFEAEIVARDGQFADVRFSLSGNSLADYLDRNGDIPLPPYILKKRNEKKSRTEDREKYQTVYAEVPGSVAAPTAGLHFNEEILGRIKKITEGHVENIVLNVGLGTFLPVKSEKVEKHIMHKEHFIIPEDTAKRLNKDKSSGRKILAVGTTTVRALESAVDKNGIIEPSDKETGIFIYPGYEYRFVDSILTNFHLPQSTLIMMIAAFAGRDLILEAYNEAVRKKYRFYSYGDCMLIV